MVFLLGKLHFLINLHDRRRIVEAVRQAVGAGMPDRIFSRLPSRVIDGIRLLDADCEGKTVVSVEELLFDRRIHA